MKCPVCNDVNLLMSDRQGIEIDYCPECRGVWLDRGELDKIIERSSVAVPQQNSKHDESRSKQHSQNSRDYEYQNKKKKKGSLLGELFDF
jgi:Zn-finger nucleic acid-binding protein